jgi:hypothetical protein
MSFSKMLVTSDIFHFHVQNFVTLELVKTAIPTLNISFP